MTQHSSFYFTVIFLFITISPFLLAQEKEHRKVELGEIHEVASKITGKDYELIINYPYSYYQDTTKYYPVVYFCDGFYDFPTFAMIYANQSYDQTVSECFLVGFSYKGTYTDYNPLRMYDYTPTRMEQYNTGGGASDFLKVVEKEFIPYMEKNFRINTSWRALGGSSAGGIFTLYALFEKPELFNAYMAISPATIWDNEWIFKTEDEFSKKHNELNVSLFMTGAEKEDSSFVKSIVNFDKVLQKRNYKNFRYQFRILDGQYHAGSKPEGYSRGMMYIFEPLLK